MRSPVADAGAAPDPARRVEKPWGFEVWFAVNDRYAGKLIHIDPGEELSLQYHQLKDETLMVLSGQLELELEGADGELSWLSLGPGSWQRIQPPAATGCGRGRRRWSSVRYPPRSWTTWSGSRTATDGPGPRPPDRRQEGGSGPDRESEAAGWRRRIRTGNPLYPQVRVDNSWRFLR